MASIVWRSSDLPGAAGFRCETSSGGSSATASIPSGRRRQPRRRAGAPRRGEDRQPGDDAELCRRGRWRSVGALSVACRQHSRRRPTPAPPAHRPGWVPGAGIAEPASGAEGRTATGAPPDARCCSSAARTAARGTTRSRAAARYRNPRSVRAVPPGAAFHRDRSGPGPWPGDRAQAHGGLGTAAAAGCRAATC